MMTTLEAIALLVMTTALGGLVVFASQKLEHELMEYEKEFRKKLEEEEES